MKQEELILEGPCRVASGSYMRHAMGLWLSRHWVWIAVAAVVCASLATIDVKWCIVAYILTLAALMMVLSLVYFDLALSPLARWSVMAKTVKVTRRGIEMMFEHERMDDHSVEWKNVKRIQLGANCTILHMAGRGVNMLVLPGLEADEAEVVKRMYLMKE